MVFKRIKLDKCLGPDGVHPQTLWDAWEEIEEAFARIFHSSLATSEVPEDWRASNAVLLFKKSNKDKPGNYRPMSLMPVVERLWKGFSGTGSLAFGQAGTD